MPYNKEELSNLSKLLLSVDDSNVELAFELIDQGGVTKELVSELFAIYKLGSRKHRLKSEKLLEGISDQSPGLAHILQRKSYLNGSVPRKKIKSFADDCPDVDPMKLAMALYNKFGEGLQYLVSELPEEELKDMLGKHLSGEKFELVFKKITKIPKHIFDYSQLTELNLSRNQIKTLPAGIGKLSKLEKLDISDNKINKLNKAIAKLKNLKELNISQNSIKELPKELANLENLSSLNLCSNSFPDFPMVVTQIPNLERLKMYSISGSYTRGPMDEAFFDFKSKKLVEVQFDYQQGEGQTRWPNIPRVSIVNGTAEDPISMQPLLLAKRAFEQNQEGIEYLLEHADSDYKKKVLKPYVEGHKLHFQKRMYWDSLPEEVQPLDIRHFCSHLGQITENFWASLKYMPNLEILDFGLEGDFKFGMWTDKKSFPLAELAALPNLRILRFGQMEFPDIFEKIEELPNIEELWFWDYNTIEEVSEIAPKFGKFEVLAKLKKLKKFCIRGIANDYYNDEKKDKKIKEAVAQHLRQWLPADCEILVGRNSTNTL